MRVGVCIIPDEPWQVSGPRWKRLEELGFDHAWIYDHLVWGPMSDSPWHSTMATLGAAAASTSTIALGTWVSSPNFRHPVPLARDLVTLNDMSSGRMICGVGSGGEPDVSLLGEQLTRGQRTRRFFEFVEVLQQAMTTDPVNHQGDFYAVDNYRNLVGAAADRHPKLVLAANGPRTIEFAVEQLSGTDGGWATTGLGGEDQQEWWSRVSGLVQRLEDAGGSDLDRYLYLDAAAQYSLTSRDFCLEQLHQAKELGFTDVVLTWPRPDEPFKGTESVLEEVAASLAEVR